MAEKKYGKYVVSEPKKVEQLAHHSREADYPWKNQAEVYLDDEMVPGCPVWFDINWIFDTHLPSVPDWILPHKHDYNEILLFVATNPEQELGGEIQISLGEEGEKHTFSHTTAIFVPKGLLHCPIVYKSVDKNKPQMMMALLFNPKYT